MDWPFYWLKWIYKKEMLAKPEYKNLISNFASQKARRINFKWKYYDGIGPYSFNDIGL